MHGKARRDDRRSLRESRGALVSPPRGKCNVLIAQRPIVIKRNATTREASKHDVRRGILPAPARGERVRPCARHARRIAPHVSLCFDRSTLAKERKKPRTASHLHNSFPCLRARRVLAQTLGVLRPSGASGVDSRRVAVAPYLPSRRERPRGRGSGSTFYLAVGCRARSLARDSCYLVTMLRHRAEQHRESGGLRPGPSGRGARGLGASELLRSALSRQTHGRRRAMRSLAVCTTALDVEAIRTRAGLKPLLARGTEAGDAEDLVERVVGESDVRGGLAVSALPRGGRALSTPLGHLAHRPWSNTRRALVARRPKDSDDRMM